MQQPSGYDPALYPPPPLGNEGDSSGFEQLAALDGQYSELLHDRFVREQEISARTTERQLQQLQNDGRLEAWGLAPSEPTTPFAGLPTPSSLAPDQLPFSPHPQYAGQQWGVNPWAYSEGMSMSTAGVEFVGSFPSGMPAITPVSPTDAGPPPSLPFPPELSALQAAHSTYPSTPSHYYYPEPNPPPEHKPVYDQYQRQYQPQPTLHYQQHYPDQRPPTSNSPFAYPSPYSGAGDPTSAYPRYAAPPPPLRYPQYTTPSTVPLDQDGRPSLLEPPRPLGAQPPPPQLFYGLQQQYTGSSHPQTTYGPPEHSYEAYAGSTPSTDVSHPSHEPSPQDSWSSGRSRQHSFADAMPSTSTSAPASSFTTLAPPSTAPSSSTIDFAAANEVLLAQPIAAPKRARVQAAASGSSSSAPHAASGPLKPRASRKGSKRTTADLMAACNLCGELIARLILRGQEAELAVPHSALFTCVNCAEGSPESAENDRGGSTSNDAKPTSFRKRHNKRGEQGAVLTACDVCLRDVASGSVVPEDQQAAIDFQIEVVCSRCDERYRRCSDCGGGGGARLGVGKWRSKELFAGKRKTCSLSHLRLGALSDMHYDVHSVTEIPRNEVDEVADICGEIFSNTMYAGIAIPEVLEHQSAVAKNFAEVQVMATRGWGAIQRMIKVDIEQQRSIRRYLALRSCAPNPRKGAQPLERPPVDRTRVILRENKDVVGFIIAEWDTLIGSLFLAVVVPWAMGEVYDATTILIQALFRRVEEDRCRLNAERFTLGLPDLPPVTIVWTMMFFQKDSRMIGHLEKKRGFSHLSKFLQANPDVPAAVFPPLRPIYLPPERQQGWQVMVRKREGPTDNFFSIRRTSASEDVERKKKEQKARSRREEESNQWRE